MKFLLWWWFEGRPSTRIKREIEMLAARLEGQKMYRRQQAQLRELEKQKPLYNSIDLGKSFNKLKNTL